MHDYKNSLRCQSVGSKAPPLALGWGWGIQGGSGFSKLYKPCSSLAAQGHTGWISALYYQGTLGKVFESLIPQIPQLQNGDNSCAYLAGLQWMDWECVLVTSTGMLALVSAT